MAPFAQNGSMSDTLPYGTGDASYQAAGGIDGLRRLVDDFYRLMDERPEAAALRALHPAGDADAVGVGGDEAVGHARQRSLDCGQRDLMATLQ